MLGDSYAGPAASMLLTMAGRSRSESDVRRPGASGAPDTNPPSAPCVMAIFGASGDLTKRLLVPALYNLACDGLL